MTSFCSRHLDLPHSVSYPLLCKEGGGEVEHPLPHLASPYKGEEIEASVEGGMGRKGVPVLLRGGRRQHAAYRFERVGPFDRGA